MEQNISRRNFMKGTAAVALATATSGLLGGCASSDLVGDAVGLGKAAELSNISMTVNAIYSYSDRSTNKFYIVPKVTIRNEGAAAVAVKPVSGNFRIIVNGSTELTCDKDAASILEDFNGVTAMVSSSINRGQKAQGCLCGSGPRGTALDYVTIIFYPNEADRHTYLRCKITETPQTLL